MTDDSNNQLVTLFHENSPKNVPVDVTAIFNHPRDERRFWIRTGLAASALIGFFFVLTFLATNPGSTAFAEMKTRVAEIRTAAFVEVHSQSFDSKDDKKVAEARKAASLLDGRIASLRSRLEEDQRGASKDIGVQLKALEQARKNSNDKLISLVTRVRIKGKHRKRSDELFPKINSVTVDTRNGVVASFDHQKKQVSRITKQTVADSQTGKQRTDNVSPNLRVDFFEMFRRLPDKARQIGRQTANGRPVVGFQCSIARQDGRVEYTSWIDDETKLPVSILVEYRPKGVKDCTIRYEKCNFVFDEKMEDSIFDSTVPDGYRLLNTDDHSSAMQLR